MSPEQAKWFSIFWAEYPRKDAKIAAQRAWRKLNPGECETFAILLGIQAYQRSGLWKERKYIMLPATFLNGRRWEDEVSSAKVVDYVEHPSPRYCATCGHTGSWHKNEVKHNRPPNHEFLSASDTENVAQPSGAIAQGRM